MAVSGTAVNSVGVTDPDDVTLTIRDDDAPAGKVTLELTPATINESGTGNASTVTASVPSASSATTTVTVSVNPAGHHDADREHDPDHPGGGHRQHGGGDHHGGERRRLHLEPDGGGERDGGEQRGDNRPGRRGR